MQRTLQTRALFDQKVNDMDKDNMCEILVKALNLEEEGRDFTQVTS